MLRPPSWNESRRRNEGRDDLGPKRRTSDPGQPSRLRAFWRRRTNMPLSLYSDGPQTSAYDQRAGRNFLLSLANLHHQIERSILRDGLWRVFLRSFRACDLFRPKMMSADGLPCIGLTRCRTGLRCWWYGSRCARADNAPGLRDLHSGSGICRFTASLRARQHHVVVGLSTYGGDISWRSQEIGVVINCRRINCARSCTIPRRRWHGLE